MMAIGLALAVVGLLSFWVAFQLQQGWLKETTFSDSDAPGRVYTKADVPLIVRWSAGEVVVGTALLVYGVRRMLCVSRAGRVTRRT
jgi:Ni/Fe-hydrogenase subunit HybB-like protein